MGDFATKVIVGNIVLRPGIIKQFLVKSHYFLIYDPKEEKLTLNANHGGVGQTLFEVRNVSYESAVKLAEGLGLKGRDENPLIWSKWNPILQLHHDGSEDAEALRMEMLRLGIPHTICHDSKVLGLVADQGIHEPPSWTITQMLEIIRKTTERYKEQLTTIP